MTVEIQHFVEFARDFREWYANHFEAFHPAINSQLLCLDNTAAHLLGEDEPRYVDHATQTGMYDHDDYL